MKYATLLAAAFALHMACLPARAQAPKVDVELTADALTLQPGQRSLVQVRAQIKPGYATHNDGLFSWCLDLQLDSPETARWVPGSVLRPGWLGDSRASSDGSMQPGMLTDVYDLAPWTELNMGVGQSVLLLSVEIEALAEGTVELMALPGDLIDADFALQSTSYLRGPSDPALVQGDYQGAQLSVEVVPEPASLLLLCAGGAGLLARRRRRN
jgi:hypothetical protein